jgi:hypothetical protein
MKKLLLLCCLSVAVLTVDARCSKLSFGSNFFTQKVNVIISAYIENSNVFIEYADKSVKQLTFANSDSSPILLKKENAILFIRKIPGTFFNQDGLRINGLEKLMRVNCSSLIETIITDKKPFEDGLYSTTYIVDMRNPTLSLNELHVYLIIECYTTGYELVKVDIKTGKMIKLFPADNFELIKNGQYKGLFFVGRGEIKGGGRTMYYYLLNENNDILKEFDSEYSYRIFKKNTVYR